MPSVRALIGRVGQVLPHGWRDFWIQFLVFWTFNLSYELSRGIADGGRATAFANGRRVMDVERSLGIFWERGIQDWVLGAPAAFLDVANWTYFNCQFTVSILFLIWAYWRRSAYFARIRDAAEQVGDQHLVAQARGEQADAGGEGARDTRQHALAPGLVGGRAAVGGRGRRRALAAHRVSWRSSQSSSSTGQAARRWR